MDPAYLTEKEGKSPVKNTRRRFAWALKAVGKIWKILFTNPLGRRQQGLAFTLGPRWSVVFSFLFFLFAVLGPAGP